MRSTSKEFAKVLAEMQSVRDAKVAEYGDSRYREKDPLFSMMMAFSDIHRKYIRLRSQTLRVSDLLPDPSDLRETYLDLANYAAMGVQLLDNPPLDGPDTPPVEMSKWPIQQLAIYTTGDPEELAYVIGKVFSLRDPWVHDTVRASGTVFDEPTTVTADLMFHYGIGPFEFEILHYHHDSPDNWLNASGVTSKSPIGLSHLGLHVEDVGTVIRFLKDRDFKVAQEVTTESHTNPAIRDSRRYKYVIFDTRACLGFDLKFIQRILLDPEPVLP